MTSSAHLSKGAHGRGGIDLLQGPRAEEAVNPPVHGGRPRVRFITVNLETKLEERSRFFKSRSGRSGDKAGPTLRLLSGQLRPVSPWGENSKRVQTVCFPVFNPLRRKEQQLFLFIHTFIDIHLFFFTFVFSLITVIFVWLLPNNSRGLILSSLFSNLRTQSAQPASGGT